MDVLEQQINRQIGARIKQRRIKLKYSQKKVAGYLGISFQQLQKYENGKNRISAAKLRLLSIMLKESPLYFYFNDYIELKINNSKNYF